jgi:hypothetical protein
MNPLPLMTQSKSKKPLKDLETPPWRSENQSTLNKTRTAKTKTPKEAKTPTPKETPTNKTINKRRNEHFQNHDYYYSLIQ